MNRPKVFQKFLDIDKTYQIKKKNPDLERKYFIQNDYY